MNRFVFFVDTVSGGDWAGHMKASDGKECREFLEKRYGKIRKCVIIGITKEEFVEREVTYDKLGQ